MTSGLEYASNIVENRFTAIEQRKQRINGKDAIYIKANENITTSKQAVAKVMQILRTRVCAQQLYIDHTKTIAESKAFVVDLPPGHKHKPVFI